MSYTNHTTNYNLPQYIGTDKPTYLGDFNSAMSAIDTQMKLNADTASTAGTNATTANTNIGTLASLTTETKTDLVSAINEVDNHADTAQTTANSANETAGSALSTATGVATEFESFKTYMTLSSFNTYTTSNLSVISGGGTVSSSTISVAKNSSGTLCKIYGTIGVANPTSTSIKVKLNVDTGLRPEEKITVTGLGIIEIATGGLSALNVDINVDGTVEFYGNLGGVMTYGIRSFACLVFVKDFGDQPE